MKIKNIIGFLFQTKIMLSMMYTKRWLRWRDAQLNTYLFIINNTFFTQKIVYILQ